MSFCWYFSSFSFKKISSTLGYTVYDFLAICLDKSFSNCYKSFIHHALIKTNRPILLSLVHFLSSHCIAFHFLSCIVFFCCTVHHCLFSFLIFKLNKLNLNLNYTEFCNKHTNDLERYF